ncbi:MAG: hypothetical protein SVY15_04115 [Halobacteriota archaeon]|nr:hypothetical protein [Halobacteriota archaeon]
MNSRINCPITNEKCKPSCGFYVPSFEMCASRVIAEHFKDISVTLDEISETIDNIKKSKEVDPLASR